MDCEEDASSLLSLSHSLLPSENGSSTTVSSSGQINAWPEQDAANGMSGNFSPVSPPSGYSNLNHVMSESSNNSKFYLGRPSTSHNFSRANIMKGYGRPDRSLLPSMPFPGSDPSVSHSATPEASTDFVLNAANDEQMNLYYEQVSAFRNSVNVYENHHSLVQVNSGANDGFEHEGQHLNVSQTNDPVLSHPGYSNDHASLAIDRPQHPEAMVEDMARSSHLNNHSNSGDVMPASPAFFEARVKQMEYSKEMPEIGESSMAKNNHQIFITSERRSVEASNLDNVLDFATMSASSSNNYSNQFDYNSISRSGQELDYRLDPSQDGNIYNASQEQASMKYAASSTLSPEHTDSVSRRPVAWEYSGLQMNPQQQQHQQQSEELHFNYNQKKLPSSEHESSMTKQSEYEGSMSKQIMMGLQFQRLGGPVKLVSNSGRFDNAVVEDNRHSDVKSSLSSKDCENWSVRTRAHRKMARLLGQISCSERTTKSQSSDTRLMSFPKLQPSLMQSPYRETQKPQGSLVKSHYPQKSPQPLASNAQLLQGNERDVRSVSYSLGQDQGNKREDDFNKHQGGIQDFNLPASFGLAPDGQSSTSRDPSSLLGSNQLLATSHLDLDFPQTLNLDSSHDPVGQEDLFTHSIDSQQISQHNLGFPDNLNPQNSQELSLESYLNSTTDKELDLMRKYPDQAQRELTDNDLDFAEYIESSRLTPNYFERPSNLPQDMTMYQKSNSDKFSGTHPSCSKMKDRDSFHCGKANSRQAGLSDLQKELNKTSTKDSMKGIRIPRDINRAMEILQDMQEDERAEERRKTEELQKQLHTGVSERKEQQQHQVHRQHVGVNSSPKKTFQNKHQIESLTLTDQQILRDTVNFIEEQSVQTVNFLDQPPVGFSETQQQSNAMLCEPSLQDMTGYSACPVSHQVPEMDLSIMGKREHQPNDGYGAVNSVLDGHVFKKIAMSNACKDQGINSSLSSIGMPSMAPHGHDLSFGLSGVPRFPDQLSLPDDGLPNRLNMAINYTSMDLDHLKHDLPYQTKDVDVDKFQSFQAFGNDASNLTIHDKHSSDKRENNILASARQNLYSMMKKEQLCDAVLSVSQQNVKVHQVVLCSLSHYLCNLLLNSQPSSHQRCSLNSSITRYGVVVMINCDTIKSSSVTAFLMFIYLGKTDFNESNVVDLFILASSLHVSPLKDLCKEYMWKVQISEDQMKIPPVHIVHSMPVKQNLACQVNLSGGTATEDKCVNTGNVVKSMPAATQTDKLTSGVGGGGQEEWVMLKKTKQKTVSPSKTKFGNAAKCSSVVDSSVASRPGKKGWLSPKRRFKTEQHLAKVYNVEQDALLKQKFTNTINTVDDNELHNGDMQRQAFSSTHNNLKPLINEPVLTSFNAIQHSQASQTSSALNHKAEAKIKQMNSSASDLPVLTNQSLGPKPKTTVEIAEEAAAAKSAAHNYGTRLSGRGSNKQGISYSALVHGYDKKRAASSARETPSLIKKKDFVKNHAAPTLSSKGLVDVSTTEKRDGKELLSSFFVTDHEAVPFKGASVISKSEASPGFKSWKSPFGKPLKKNIAQRAQDNEISADSSNPVQLPFTDNMSITTDDHQAVEDLSRDMCSSASSSLSTSSVTLVSEADLTNVSSIIDSLVNTFQSEGGESELQIVLSDLDAELGNALLAPTIPKTSSSTIPTSSSSTVPTSSSTMPTPPSTVSTMPTSSSTVPTIPTSSSSTLPTIPTSSSSTLPTIPTSSSSTLPTIPTTSLSTVSTIPQTSSSGISTFPKSSSLVVSTILKTSSSTIPKTSSSGISTFPKTSSSGISTFPKTSSLVVSAIPKTSSSAIPKTSSSTIPKTSSSSMSTIPKTSSSVGSTFPKKSLLGISTFPKTSSSTISKTSSSTLPTILQTSSQTMSTIPTSYSSTVPTFPTSSSSTMPPVLSLSKSSYPVDMETSPFCIVAQPPLSSSSSSSPPLMSRSEVVTSYSGKMKTTPQGFRKRLIQLMKSESAKATDLNVRFDEPLSVLESISGGQSIQTNQYPRISDKNASPSPSLTDQDASEQKNDWSNQKAAGETKETDQPSVNFVTKDEEETQFHKLFKRKRKAKFRKSLGNDVEAQYAKNRTKKGPGSEQETGINTKVRQRKNTAYESDSGSAKPKMRKITYCEADSNVLKVRPPPKKRAKMELELLKVATKKSVFSVSDSLEGGSETAVKTISKQGNADVDAPIDCAESKLEAEKSVKLCTFDKRMPEENIGQCKEKRAKKNCGGKIKKFGEECKEKKNSKDPTTMGQIRNSKRESSLKVSKEIGAYVQLLEEKQKNSQGTDQLFSCTFCQVQFKSAQRTVKHVMVFHQVTGDEVLGHISLDYEGKSQEACDICGYVTKDTTYKYMHYHKYFKHNVPLPKGWSLCKCQICGREFHTNFHLKEHIQSHSENFFFVCWYCGQNFKTRNSFNSHIFHKHTKERKHLCKICQKTFKTWTQLKIHVRSHTGERPFVCTECDYGSTTQGNMRYHLTNRHDMDKATVEGSMKKICSKTPETNPAALEELMKAVLAKIIPDKAFKEPKKRNARSKKQTEKNGGKRESFGKTTTTSSSVSTQMKAYLSDKASSSSCQPPPPSLSSRNYRTTSHTTVSPIKMKAYKSKGPLKIKPKDPRPTVSHIPPLNQVVILPPTSSASQDPMYLQANSAAPTIVPGYALLPSQTLPGFATTSGTGLDGTSTETSSLLLLSQAGLLSAGTAADAQDNSGFQILEVNSGVPQVNIILNDASNSIPSQFPGLHFPTPGTGVRCFPNPTNSSLVLNSIKTVSDDECQISNSLQNQMGQYLLYAYSPAVGQPNLLTEGTQQGMQPLFISYPVMAGHQIAQSLPEMQLVPHAQEAVSATSGELVPLLLTDQMMGPAGDVETMGEEEGDGRSDHVVLALDMSDVAKSQVKKEGEVAPVGERTGPGQIAVASSS